MRRARMVDDVLAERIMRIVACDFGRLGRFEAHVVPAQILEVARDLAKTLRPHGRAGGALAREKSGRERGDRLGLVHFVGSLLTDDATAEAADGTRTGRRGTLRLTRRSEDGPAEILLEAI